MLETDQALETETTEGNLSGTIDAQLKLLRLRNVGQIIIAYLNINSIRNKFEALREIIASNMDISMVAETKIDSSFPRGQFLIDGFAPPYRLGRNKDGGGLLVYVRSDIP